MAGAYLNLGALMASDQISISRTPFNPDIVVLKRPSFPKGEVPAHLKSYLYSKGDCKDKTGTIVYRGKLVPATAACQAEKHPRKKK